MPSGRRAFGSTGRKISTTTTTTVLTDAATLLPETKGLTQPNNIMLALGRVTPSMLRSYLLVLLEYSTRHPPCGKKVYYFWRPDSLLSLFPSFLLRIVESTY
jgi:hypothetical protein